MLDTFAGARGRRAPPVNPAGANSPIPIATDLPTVRVVTYNIHTCVGVDRRYDPARIVAVLRGIDADIACLQEVDARRRIERHADQWAYLSEATGCQVVLGGGDRRGRFDNAILTRFPVLAARTLDLTVAGYEPRGAIDADLLIGDRVLRDVSVYRTPLARLASDHLPLVGSLSWAPHDHRRRERPQPIRSRGRIAPG